MEIKILQVFYDKNGLPYKDKERTVHYPITSGTFLGASNTTQIRFYYDQLDELNESTFVAVSKLPNGKIGSEILESEYDSELQENYAVLNLSQFYTQYKGDVFISLQGYQGGVRVEQDENGIYQIYGTPTIQATGSIRMYVAYAPTFVGSGQTENITLQRVLAELATKLGIRQETLHVEELPTVGNPNVWYVINDDSNDVTKANIYIWNATTQTYVWVGDNTLNLGDYYTQEEGQSFEQGIENRVQNVEDEVSSVASGSPAGVYATASDLTTDDPDHSKIYLVTDDGKWYYYNTSTSSWTAGGVYLSSENYEKAMYLIGDLENKYIRYNLFDKNSPFIQNNKYINYTNGAVTNENGWSALIFEIEANKSLVIDLTSSGRIMYCFYDENNTFISGSGADRTSSTIITTPSTAKYIGFSCTNATLDVARLYYGTIIENVYRQFEEVAPSNNLDLSIASVDKVSKENYFALQGKSYLDLMNDATIRTGKYINFNNGNEVNDDNYSYSNFVNIIYNSLFLVKNGQSFFYAFYNKNKEYISGGNLGTDNNLLLIPNNENIVYIKFSYPTSNATGMFFKLLKYVNDEDKKIFATALNINKNNLIEYFIDGYYVAYNTGRIIGAETYTITNPIEVIYNAKYILEGASSGAQCAFFDKNGSYISGLVTSTNEELTIPNNKNIKYMIWCSLLSNKANMSISIKPVVDNKNNVVIVNGTSILQGVMDAYESGAKKVIIRAGNYDVIAEYKTKYGNDYFDNYTDNYNGSANGYYDSGIWLDNIEIIFEQGTKVTANYDGNNAYVKQYFSAFAVGRNVIIDGLVLEASELRYGLHPDYNGDSAEQSFLIVKNGDFSFYKGADNLQSFGCGLGKCCLWTFENNIFRCPLDRNLPVLRIHNSGYPNAQSKIIMKDNYIDGKGTFKFNYYGTTTKVTDVLVCGNSYINEPLIQPETQDSTIVNVEIIKWNNEIRS